MSEKNRIIKGLYEGNYYCCGKDLGELTKENTLICPNCKTLVFIPEKVINPQKKITDIFEKERNNV